ncbi:SWIM zinc finger family protein [Nocardioides sp. zg-DK7169]|uniref:SWIM zinc finger family protein n=1 Tax=Nocardioides sp. zg-DK7169 TaxID=2736600 RepID=UPI001553C9B4|nr:SWIM zinc finger family protein [Nocardioides sp. zg-DK7169]NPC98098.1 hypothetical protein [Nocardioides sp. zg-DK7169]
MNGPPAPDAAGAVTHRRLPARRGGTRTASWWGRAWLRAVEEAAYSDEDLVAGRAVARSGRVGRITVESGGFLAAVEDDGEAWTVVGAVPVLDRAAADAFVETVAAESGRVAALLAGDLPHALVEHAEEAGVELLPYGGELGASCTCDAWTDPCPHALGVLLQLGRLLDEDPFVLLHLRGLPREDLLARLHALSIGAAPSADAPGAAAEDPAEHDLDTGIDAVERARRLLELLDQDPSHGIEHLL